MSRTITIFLSGACKGIDNYMDWREKTKEKLKIMAGYKESNVIINDPMEHFDYGTTYNSKAIKNVYMKLIDESDVLLVNLEHTNGSIGTAQEVQHAIDMGKIVIGFNKDRDSYDWIQEVDCTIAFDDMTKAIDFISDHFMR